MKTIKPDEILEGSLKYLQEHGWVQGVVRTSDGRVCLAGAMDYFCMEHFESPSVYADLSKPALEARLEARRIVGDILGDKDKKYRHRMGKWNDQPDRTQAEVEDVLKIAAIHARNTDAS